MIYSYFWVGVGFFFGWGSFGDLLDKGGFGFWKCFCWVGDQFKRRFFELGKRVFLVGDPLGNSLGSFFFRWGNAFFGLGSSWGKGGVKCFGVGEARFGGWVGVGETVY